mmetsp:Transcript_42552/g.77273  ORF Transcript_42552/g.77273 Transcript_42552/m.77273 type:complete len:489 (-) Transcript_42552:95-1561(-)
MAMTQAPKLQRTYSDPDLPQLLPLPVRPSSSYEPRPKAKEFPQFGTEVVEAMAKQLGLDVEEDSSFRWVIRDCLLSLREEGWKCVVNGEDLMYEHVNSEEPKADHPIVTAHRKLAERLHHARADLKMKRLDPHYCIRHMVYLAIMGEKDVRRVSNPKLLLEILRHLDINPQDEPYLIHRIKVTVEDAYFRMKKLGMHVITIENCIDVESLQVNLELERAGFMKKISPSGLLYCVECQTQLGDVISAGCHDILCNACAVETHNSGHRQDVPLVFFEQSVCAECGLRAALVRCQDCVELFCYECFKTTHARGKRKRHCVGLPQRTFCSECDEREAAYICVESEDVLCTRCAARMHRRGARQNHTLFGLRKAAYNKKLFADNLDRLMGIMQKNIERSYPLSPWFLFYDEALAPFWYNFQTHLLVRADPNDLTNPPQVTDENEDDEDGEPADQLALQGLENLRDTHAAKFAAQGACFDVPPPVHVRYTSPVR